MKKVTDAEGRPTKEDGCEKSADPYFIVLSYYQIKSSLLGVLLEALSSDPLLCVEKNYYKNCQI